MKISNSLTRNKKYKDSNLINAFHHFLQIELDLIADFILNDYILYTFIQKNRKKIA